MQTQLDLFAAPPTDRHSAHIKSWEVCWGWHGPVAGEYCQVDTPIAETEGGDPLYCYMERCRLIELRADGRWLAVIEMGTVHGKPWPKDGARLLLEITDIWPVTHDHNTGDEE